MSNDFGHITRDHLVSGQYYMPIYHMDIEVLPEWWSIVFRHKAKKIEFTSDDYDLEAIKKICRLGIITAYNAKRYDLKILLGIINDLEPALIYKMSKAIIENNGYSEDIRIAKYLKSGYWSNFNFIDLIDDMTGSLKEHESNMSMEIIESSIPWDKTDLTNEEIRELLFYNHHDVKAQEKIFERRIDSYFLPKIILAEMYGLDPVAAMKDTNASLTAKILKARKLPPEMTEDRYYQLPHKISDYVYDYVDEDIINTYLTTGMDVVNKKSIKATAFNNTGNFGKGGLHTVMRDHMRVSSSKEKGIKLFLIDVASYYPNLMIWFNFMSRSVKDRTSFPEIYKRRVQAKKKKQKALDKALKLILNSTFGAMGLKYNNLFDPNMAWSVTITGQLLLYALANELYQEANCKIIQTNTDGITLAIKEKDIPKMEALIKKWEGMTDLSMDSDEIDLFVQANVNNYVCKFTDGTTKVKGRLCMQALTCDETAFEVVKYTNWDMRIVHEAVFRYLLYKEPMEDTIRKCTDLKMFISTTKTGSSYSQTYYYQDDKPIKVQKVNRVVAVDNSRCGTIKKFKITKGRKPKTNCTSDEWKSAVSLLDQLMNDLKFDKNNVEDAEIKMRKINQKLSEKIDNETILKSIILRKQYDKIAGISEHVYILNKDMSEYDWKVWKNRIDYDFYINTAKDRIEGFLK